MNTELELKTLVKEKYAQIAEQSSDQNAASCCGATCCGTEDVYNIMADDYTKLEGYVSDADLGLGCGLPTEFAQISEGDTVIDLGSGAGNDAFIARRITGEKGRVIGVDFTEKMVAKAKENAAKLGYTNVEFHLGDIEELPLEDSVADVIVSNCVLNLVPNKANVFKQIFRTLKAGGHFSISDIVLAGELPEGLKKAAEMYAGCVSGAIQKDEYLDLIKTTGFTKITLQKEKAINVPDEILLNYITKEQLDAFKTSGTGIYSITVYAEKPAAKTCCGPECCN